MKLDRKQILTIPNMLSLLRLLMIPAIAAFYLHGHETWAAAMLILSGITDVADGFIARKLGQISDLGKALDPVADKLTQAVMLLCLVSDHPLMILPFILLTIKELFAAISGLVVIKRTGVVLGAEWHGKLTTAMLYGMMILHLIWQEIPLWVSNAFTISCIAMMLLSLCLYARRNVQAIRDADRKRKESASQEE